MRTKDTRKKLCNLPTPHMLIDYGPFAGKGSQDLTQRHIRKHINLPLTESKANITRSNVQQSRAATEKVEAVYDRCYSGAF
jgi:hypothetical protein